MGQALRLFVAIRVPAEVQRALGAAQRHLAGAGMDMRWTRPEGIHLTLVFLGNVDETRVAEIEAAMEAAARQAAAFRLVARNLGCFPPRGTPRVLWAGLDGDLDRLRALQRDLDRRLRDAGFTLEERAFTPHLTLGRAGSRTSGRGPAASVLPGILGDAAQTFGSWQVREIELIRSQLHPSGSIYTTLFSAPLGSGDSAGDSLGSQPGGGQDTLRSGQRGEPNG